MRALVGSVVPEALHHELQHGRLDPVRLPAAAAWVEDGSSKAGSMSTRCAAGTMRSSARSAR